MQVVLFYHSLVSDWNHGNAHFLRGIAGELLARDIDVQIYEPVNAWSVENLLKIYGEEPLQEFQELYPNLKSHRYRFSELDLNKVLADADLVIVHEWNDPELVKEIGQHKAVRGGYQLLFHDTHHRSVSDPKSMSAYNLSNYDGVLAFGKIIRDIYLEKGWANNAWIWHEAADTRVFKPLPKVEPAGDLVWVGNWGDDERTAELHEFLIKPVQELNLKAKIYGVRYPKEALQALESAGIEYGGWLPNYKVPAEFAKYKMTVHVPRRPYVEELPGIPTIRPFEAMACGIPLICSPWDDAEDLFHPGQDYLTAGNGQEMKEQMQKTLEQPELAKKLKKHALQTILTNHTCYHRVNELLGIYRELKEKDPENLMTAKQEVK